MVGQPASYTELIRQDERDEELLEVPKPPEGARSTSRSNSNISIMETCWNPNVDIAPQAESRCPECFPMDEHNCTYLLMQTIQDQARLAEAKTQREFLTSEAQLAERARLDREEMAATMTEVRKTFDAERLALAMAARVRERELVEQMYHQTAAAKRQAEMEAESRYLEMMASERQAVVAATNQSVDAKTVAAAAAAARVEGEQIAT
eukprot:7861956-Pyramimonas_sp.AAC.1